MFIGIDVSQKTVNMASSCGTLRLDGVNPVQAAQALDGRGVILAVLEATGGYERPMADALRKQGISVAVINPRQARDFAGALGIRAKTDRIDALVLARLAQTLKPEPAPAKTDAQNRLQALTTRRQQVSAMLTQEKNRLQQTADPDVLQSIKDSIKILKASLEALTGRLKDQIADNEVAKALQDVPGIGPVCAASLLAFLPELGSLNRQAIAALAGVAPMDRQSGQWKGKSFCSGGRTRVGPPLYMAALAATRHNEEIRRFYQRLVDAGKPKKLALVACMRKLLCHLNSVARQARTENA